MRAHYLQHVPFEGLGSIEAWLEARGAEIAATRLFAGEPLPPLADVDLLVVMGGPMSVNDEDAHPWLVAEKRFVAEAIAAGRPVLGICLGSQLIASAFGAKVFPNAEREIGWFPVEAVEGAASRFAPVFAAAQDVFHWHGETFELPSGAAHLARSAGCEHQAFAVGDRVLGLQFHLETLPETARALIEHCPEDLAPGRFVQTPDEMLSPTHAFTEINATMDRILERLIGDP